MSTPYIILVVVGLVLVWFAANRLGLIPGQDEPEGMSA
jgi:hypothetical protein